MKIKVPLFYVFKLVSILTIFGSFISCQFDDYNDVYGTTGVYIVNQDYNRNLIVGEGLKLGVGVTLTGLLNNNKERIVSFKVDSTLLDDITGKTLLPPDYYSLEHPNQIIIPKGSFAGYLSVNIDSVKFLTDSKALTGEYILPIRIVNAMPDVDTIPENKSFIRISLSYFAKQFGNYHYSGELDKYMGGVLYQSIQYSHNPNDKESYRYLETIGPTSFRVTANSKNPDDPLQGISFIINIPLDGSEVTLQPDPNSQFIVNISGSCTYDADNRKFHLEYTWKDKEGANCFVVEDLIFRNRIYDDQGNGIYLNEWRF